MAANAAAIVQPTIMVEPAPTTAWIPGGRLYQTSMRPRSLAGSGSSGLAPAGTSADAAISGTSTGGREGGGKGVAAPTSWSGMTGAWGGSVAPVTPRLPPPPVVLRVATVVGVGADVVVVEGGTVVTVGGTVVVLVGGPPS